MVNSELSSQEEVFDINFDILTDQTSIESVSNQSLFINNQFNSPETIIAPFGKALRFDGHSTYIESTDIDLRNSINREMSVETWYSTEAFNQSSVGLIVQQDVNAGFSLKIRSYGQVLFQYFADNQSGFVQTTSSIPVYEWNHILAQINLDNNTAQIYLNGVLAAEKQLEDFGEISLTDNTVPLFIGRDRIMNQAFGFITSTANGAMDEVKIHNRTFSSTEIENKYNLATFYESELAIDPNIRHSDDHLRPRYHFMPNTSWANETYGLTFHNNEYHLFFQKNPNAPILNFMHWGHMSSPDLVQWTEEKIPLRPQNDFSSVGKWSGTTFFDKDNEPVIAYTGVNGQFAGIGIAESSDPELIEWEDLEENPVVDRAPSSIPNQDFRDPYIWLEGDIYYMVVGSGKSNNQGGILMSYKSTDYKDWELIDPVFETTAPVGGTFWEMPYINRINEEDYILVVTPQFVGLPAKAIYWVGSFIDEVFTPYFDTPKDFELLQKHLLSPSIGLDENGEHTYIGIIPEDRNVEDQIASGWRQTFSLPRVLRLLDDGLTLGHHPHPNLCRARRNEYTEENLVINHNTEGNLPNFNGDQSEFHFKIYNPGVDKFEIRVFQNESRQLYTAITFNKATGKIGINRIKSSPFSTTEDNQFRDYTFNANDSIDVRVFLDHSIVEVFIDNLAVMSARAYPGEGSNFIDVVATSEGSIFIDSIESWEIVDKEEQNPSLACHPEFLPSDLFTTSTIDLGTINNKIVFPNPTSEFLYFKKASTSAVKIFDLKGSLQHTIATSDGLDVSNLQKGVYFGVIQNENEKSFFKFIKI